MQFQEFEKRIAKIAKIDLPAEAAHYKMAPLERLQHVMSLHIDESTVKKAGVMALFYPKEGKTYFVLIHRKTYQGVHSNQVGFPGGKYESQDKDLIATALRETEEEIGVKALDIQVLKSLSKVYIPPSNYYVFPFIGIVSYSPHFVRQIEEVEAILEIPLTEFMDDRIVSKQKVTTSYANKMEVPAYLINGYTVWGATAMMLSEVRELLKEVL